MNVPGFSKRGPKWVAEQGRDHDLREYAGGTPTGRVAFIRTPSERTESIPGKHVVLNMDRRQVTIVANAESQGVLLRIPWHSCVSANLHDEPGTTRLRLDLAVQLGVAPVQLALWFDAAQRSALDRLIAHVHPPSTTPAAVSALPVQNGTTTDVPLLDVRCAPTSDDWIVFLPGGCSADVLRRVPPVAGAVE